MTTFHDIAEAVVPTAVSRHTVGMLRHSSTRHLARIFAVCFSLTLLTAVACDGTTTEDAGPSSPDVEPDAGTPESSPDGGSPEPEPSVAPDGGQDAGTDAGEQDAGERDAGGQDAGGDGGIGPAVDAGGDGGPSDAGGGDGGPADAGDAGDADAGDADAGNADAGPVVTNPLDVPYSVEELPGTFAFTEGPLYRAAENDLLFCDIPVRTIFRRDAAGGIAPFVTQIDCNGLVLDGNDIVVAGFAGHDLKRLNQFGENRLDIAMAFEGDRLNSPNDLVFRSDGKLFLTDPAFGSDNDRVINFNGVFRVEGTTLFDEDRFTIGERPNGIALSPDEQTAYVSDSNATTLYAYTVDANGTFGPRQSFATVSTGGDGLAVDEVGNIYVTSGAGVEVISPAGVNLGAIVFPQQPANCTFGEADLRTLYVTARTKLYRVRLAIPGQPPARTP